MQFFIPIMTYVKKTRFTSYYAYRQFQGHHFARVLRTENWDNICIQFKSIPLVSNCRFSYSDNTVGAYCLSLSRSMRQLLPRAALFVRANAKKTLLNLRFAGNLVFPVLQFSVPGSWKIFFGPQTGKYLESLLQGPWQAFSALNICEFY